MTWDTTTIPTGFTANTDGTITVPSGATPGTYTIKYQICDKANPSICDSAEVKVVVSTIDAVDDPTSTIGNAGGTVPSVLTNDTLNGTSATTSNVDLTWDTTTIPTGFTANTDGTITVPSGATPGTYTIKYQICDKANPSICDSAEVKVVVSSLSIDLVDDANNDVISTVDGGVVKKSGVDLNIFDNDTVNGSSIRNASDRTNLSVTINNDIQRDGTPFTGTNPFVVDVASGKITVAQNTPIGTYTFTYKVCQVGSTTNCDTAKITIQVSPTITSQSDDYSSTPINSKNGGTLENILDNDALNGRIIGAANSGNITITLEDTGGITGLTLTPDGKVIVPAGTPVGTYNAKYTICETGTSLCTRTPSIIKIVVTDISATDDISTSKVNGKPGGIVPNLNVLTNDTLNGNTPTSSVVTIRSTPTNELEINSDGSVRVKPNTPAGTYTITYTICEVSNPTSCSNTATVTVDVLDGCELVFYNGVSANGDGHNDKFVIEGIECYPNNILKIFNRWGVLVFEKEGYDNSFNGYSTGRVTIQKQEKLPTGTYYYIFDYQDGLGTSHRKAGWLYLDNNK
ncbi:gliding motility-associated C-terminal domain-containing protein [Capnocytophaga catalasegens]|uniref:Gliding motility-associated C-terminal domain-containing protein n=1 Tax=Capnocytophaga catalasegens TaxID=1004260 RepID=A0ABQ4VM55_9FLAO|nr:gliding motility-associated C-terminal domain-containing protein [Capnocytophaga catalasegens]GJM52313.1 hypothetical protein RCZ16_06310 [Capnocytophaga catalasegens]